MPNISEQCQELYEGMDIANIPDLEMSSSKKLPVDDLIETTPSSSETLVIPMQPDALPTTSLSAQTSPPASF